MLLFSKRLKEARKRSGFTQQQLGQLVGVTKASICCYEKGSRVPTLDTLIELADILGVNFSQLLGNEEFVVADSDFGYGLNLAWDEINFIKELRNHPALYEVLIEEPERVIKLVEQRLELIYTKD